MTSTSCSRASRSTRFASSGLAKRASATVLDKAEAGQRVGGLQAFAEPRAEIQQRDLAAFAQDAALADFERDAFAPASARRVLRRADSASARAVVDRSRGRDHVDELGFVGGRHHHKSRQAAEIGDIERAGMGGAVGADKTGAIDGKPHRQGLDRDVVHDLVIGALQEGRVDRGERLEAFGGEPGAERHGMLLGDADIEEALSGIPLRTGRARCRMASRQ